MERVNHFHYRIYWIICCFYEKTGRIASGFFLVWIAALTYWIFILNPGVTNKIIQYDELNKKLSEPLPIFTVSHVADGNKLSIRQYQELKSFFDILSHYGLVVRQGNYNFLKEDEGRRGAIEVEIPMEGKYKDFIAAMDHVVKTMPLHINSVILSRSTLETNQLTIHAKVTLNGGER